MAHGDQHRERAVRLAEQYRGRLQEIRSDQALSSLGKRRAIERLYEVHEPAVREARTAWAEAVKTRRDHLERTLFGLPHGADASTTIAYRDAQDRVAAVRGAEQLGELMERAAVNGDTTLLRAAAGHAFRRSREPLADVGWSGLVAEYATQTSTGALLEEFTELSSAPGATQQLRDQMLMATPRPTELSRPESSLADQPGSAA